MTALRKTFLLLLATSHWPVAAAAAAVATQRIHSSGYGYELSLVATTTTLPASPFTVGQEETAPFPGNFLGSPYISEVTITWRHKNGDFVTGTSTVNVATAPVTFHHVFHA